MKVRVGMLKQLRNLSALACVDGSACPARLCPRASEQLYET